MGERYPDSVGVGAYRIDLHPSTAGHNYIDVSALPFHIPLGALIPQRLTNLLAGGKNLSVTHITNGCYRLHPVEWNIGEVAGHLASHFIQHSCPFEQLYRHPEKMVEFQRHLQDCGIAITWEPDKVAALIADTDTKIPPLGSL